MTPRALVLDCDGVLADTERDGHLVAFNQAFAELGHDISWSEQEYARLLEVGGGKERLRRYLQDHPGIDVAHGGDLDEAIVKLHQRKSAIYVDRVEQGLLPPRPGVRRLVEEALATGWQVAIASTSAAASVEAVVRSVVGEEAHASIDVFAGDVVPAKKPAPDIYRLAVAELGRRPREVVVVEDSGAGAAAASAAGLAHVVTVSSFTAGDHFPDAALVVNHLGDPGTPAQALRGDKLQDGLVDVALLEWIVSGRRS